MYRKLLTVLNPKCFLATLLVNCFCLILARTDEWLNLQRHTNFIFLQRFNFPLAKDVQQLLSDLWHLYFMHQVSSWTSENGRGWAGLDSLKLSDTGHSHTNAHTHPHTDNTPCTHPSHTSLSRGGQQKWRLPRKKEDRTLARIQYVRV